MVTKSTTEQVKSAALAALEAGLRLLPPHEDGSKAPISGPIPSDCEHPKCVEARRNGKETGWMHYSHTKATRGELALWYANRRHGLGAATGSASGNLEVQDFDEEATYQLYVEVARAIGLGDLVERIEHGYLEATPAGGRHWLYRCEKIAGNTKLARRPKREDEKRDPDDKVKTLIETRGEGGYIVLAPSHGPVHELGRPYVLLSGGFDTIVTITPEERAALHDLARAFDAMPKEEARATRDGRAAATGASRRPGDALNKAADWHAILEPHGWTAVYQRGAETFWRRPGKDRGISATTNFQGSGYLFVFSQSTLFEAERGYSPFAAYTILAHGGDFAAAARELAAQGFGDRRNVEHNLNGEKAILHGNTPDSLSWEMPVEFQDITGPVFPIQTLPPTVAQFVEAESVALQVPPDLIAMNGLAAGAAAIAGVVDVRIREDWTEPTNIYTAVAMPPGERKSPAQQAVFKPLRDVEADRQKSEAAEIAQRLADRDILEERLKEAKHKAATAGKADEAREARERAKELAAELAMTAVPKTTRLVADDVTPEAAASLMADHGGRLALVSSEGGILDTLAGRYSQGVANLDLFLKGWDGGEPYLVDRRSRQPERIQRPLLTIALTIQPVVLTQLGENPVFRGRGLLARFVFAVPVSKVGFRNTRPPAVPAGVRTGWDQTIRGLLTMRPDSAGQAHPLRLSSEAGAVFQAFQDDIEVMLRYGGELDGIQDWGGKLAGTVARIAGILHAFKHADDRGRLVVTSIDSLTMEAAIAIGRYLIVHAKVAFHLMGVTREEQDAEYLSKWVRRHLDGAPHQLEIKRQELWQRTRGRFHKADALDAALRVLSERGWLRDKPDVREGPGRRASTILINPHLKSLTSLSPSQDSESRDSRDFRDGHEGASEVECDPVTEGGGEVATVGDREVF